jgi:2-haloacid dehalogenase/putative hydrolase of the HAD superfamily
VDTNPALERLVSLGVSLGILSNVDDDLLAGTRQHFSVDFDLIVTAQQLRSYKPARGHFDRARSIIGGRRWLHVAQSYFHDIEPAVTLGIPVVWVNRKGEEPLGTARPTAEVRDLTELVQWLTPDTRHPTPDTRHLSHGPRPQETPDTDPHPTDRTR